MQTVLPSTGHIALFSEQMFQHLPRCLSAASHHLLVPQFLEATVPPQLVLLAMIRWGMLLPLYMPGSELPLWEGHDHKDVSVHS